MHTEPEPPQSTGAVRPDWQVRLAGLILTAAGAALLYGGLVTPLAAISSGAEQVEVHSKAVIVAPALLLLGPFFVVGGQAGQIALLRLGEAETKAKIIAAVIAAAAFGAGLALYLYVMVQADAAGYIFD